MSDNIKKNCKKHGYVLFKLKKSKNKTWYICYLCLKSQWKKDQNKRRKRTDYKAYHRNYSKKNYDIKKCLSIYLTMILLAAKIKPE